MDSLVIIEQLRPDGSAAGAGAREAEQEQQPEENVMQEAGSGARASLQAWWEREARGIFRFPLGDVTLHFRPRRKLRRCISLSAMAPPSSSISICRTASFDLSLGQKSPLLKGFR